MASSGTAVTLRNWMFTGPGNDFVCPTWNVAFKCNPTAACATDNATGRQYCCEDQQGMCWIHAASCATDGSTFNCTRGTTSWCCMTGSEICTEASGQTNICWASNPQNVLLDIAPNALKGAYSSLTSIQPAAATYTFDPVLLMAATTSSSTSSRTTGALSTPSTSNSTPTPPSSTGGPQNPNGGSSDSGAANNNNNGTSTPIASTSNGLGAGAIAGIVVGVIAAIAIGAALAWFLMSRKRKQEVEDDISGGGAGAAQSGLPPQEKWMYAGSPGSYAPTPMTGELESPQGYKHEAPLRVVGELPAAHQHYYAELSSDQGHR
ncbi:hypothetical protein B0T16DRAFT_462000 [Cercophora newfieldiana]|uniref:Uncharacterized protein n=1 Tax=Cercophora newfieldiana TaxID=92897 RepID=A0AA39XXM7_9PEZI|nr:hypothetical protein B0T16DRAFT_462000 [Cercophora newfieldiana]